MLKNNVVSLEEKMDKYVIKIRLILHLCMLKKSFRIQQGDVQRLMDTTENDYGELHGHHRKYCREQIGVVGAGRKRASCGSKALISPVNF
jgi:hypothetical protein